MGVALVAVGAACVGGCGGDGPAAPATVDGGWARPVGDGSSAAVYLTITASAADELTDVHVTASVAQRVQVVNPDDASTDEPGHLGHLDPGGSLNGDAHGHPLELPADTPVALEPGGAYLALDSLAAPLEPGDTFPVTLSFDDSPDVTLDVTVRTSPPGAQ